MQLLSASEFFMGMAWRNKCWGWIAESRVNVGNRIGSQRRLWSLWAPWMFHWGTCMPCWGSAPQPASTPAQRQVLPRSFPCEGTEGGSCWVKGSQRRSQLYPGPWPYNHVFAIIIALPKFLFYSLIFVLKWIDVPVVLQRLYPYSPVAALRWLLHWPAGHSQYLVTFFIDFYITRTGMTKSGRYSGVQAEVKEKQVCKTLLCLASHH